MVWGEPAQEGYTLADIVCRAGDERGKGSFERARRERERERERCVRAGFLYGK